MKRFIALFLALSALCASGQPYSTVKQRVGYLMERDDLVETAVQPTDAAYTATVAKAATAIQVDVGATNIVFAGHSCAYNPTNRTLTLTTD